MTKRSPEDTNLFELVRTREFTEWFNALRDRVAKRRIAERLARVQLGNFGDAKSIDGGVSELRVHYGPGYRIYYARRGTMIVILLIGGDKQRQSRDIDKARAILESLGADDDEA